MVMANNLSRSLFYLSSFSRFSFLEETTVGCRLVTVWQLKWRTSSVINFFFIFYLLFFCYTSVMHLSFAVIVWYVKFTGKLLKSSVNSLYELFISYLKFTLMYSNSTEKGIYIMYYIPSRRKKWYVMYLHSVKTEGRS